MIVRTADNEIVQLVYGDDNLNAVGLKIEIDSRVIWKVIMDLWILNEHGLWFSFAMIHTVRMNLL